jgi:DNA invertase Pin-like site-specific DNA recombinase
MSGKKIGYIRVSSYSQNDERQLDGVELDKVFREKVSAKTKDRPKLNEALEYLRDGDELHVHSIDRLARNLNDLLSIVERLVKEDVSVHFHKEHLVFNGDDNPMSKLMLHMMGAVAQFERSLIKERQAEGIVNARKKGVRFGQPPKLTDEELADLHVMAKKRYSKTAIAEHFGVSRQTVYNALKI